ncbi:MAG: hypothetical protein QXQ02_08205 [Halobacteria archaeon]
MAEEKKTIEQLTQDVFSSGMGLSLDDLNKIFEEESPQTTTQPPQQQTGEGQPESVSEEEKATPPPAEGATVAPQSPSSTAQSVTGGISPELEALIREQAKQIQELKLALESLRKEPQPFQHPTLQPPVKEAEKNPLDEIDDQDIITEPKKNIVRIVKEVLKSDLPAAFMEYDSLLQKRIMMEEFRKSHPDFDELRPIMRQVVMENPALNYDPDALPKVYEEAKRRVMAMKNTILEAIKKEAAQTVKPEPQPAPISEDELLNKLERRIAEKLSKRRAGAGTASPTTQPVSPFERVAEQSKPQTQNEVDEIIAEMLKAAPPAEHFSQAISKLLSK